MFQTQRKCNTKILIISDIVHINSILKNTIKYSEFHNANYTFADSFKNEISIVINKF
jgi:hypothetical protein